MSPQVWLNRIRGHLENPLYRNSIYLSLGRYLDAGIGFIFWIFAARLYTTADVGIATALISSLLIVVAISSLGFDTTIIRFMPTDDHNKVFNSSLWITTIAALVIGIIFLFLIDYVSPELAFITDYAGDFLWIVIVYSITNITGYALLSIRRADQKFVQNLITSGRLPLLVPFAVFGALGIFFSYGVVFTLSAMYALIIIRKHVHLSFHIDNNFVRKTIRFTSFNYFANLLQYTPLQILPVLIVGMLTPRDAALYYIAFAIGNLVLIIPNAISVSLFVEGSHGMNLREGVPRALFSNYAILIPAVLFLWFFGDILLGFFGIEYVEAFDLLRIISVSSFLVTIYWIFIVILNVRQSVRGVFSISFIRFFLVIGLSYVLLQQYGLMGTGYAWAVTHLILGLSIVIYTKYKRWI